jgi:DNA-binding PucR family transcriptional regulator
VGDVSEEIPPALLQACREHDLPLLEVPVGVPFQAITELLADHRAEARTARSRRVQRLATRLLDAMAADRPLAELVQMVQDDLGGHVTFADGVIAWSPATETDVRPARETLEHLTAVLAVRQHEEDLETTNRRLELGRLLDLVLQGRADPEVLQHPLQLAGIEAEQPIAPAAWPRKAADLVASGLSPVLLADLGDVTISLSPVPGRAREVAEALSLPCGTGEPAPLAQLRQVVPAALAALKLARERGAPVGHQELTTFQALLEQQPPDWLIPFAEKLILPLLEHDKQHGTALLETLRAFLDNDGSINATARQLFLHANSLRHRLRRIHELTGAHPQAFDDRVALAIGLWAWDRRPRASR